MKMAVTHRIALLFNSRRPYDREIIDGVAAYLSSTRVAWDLFLEDDFRAQLEDLSEWQGDGIIADYDDPVVRAAIIGCKTPLVAVGSSCHNEADYPPGLPYVAADNFKLVQMAYDHLVAAGLPRFAFYGLPEAPETRWAQERQHGYMRLMRRDRLPLEIYQGSLGGTQARDDTMDALIGWLQSLAKPVGIVAVNDARARQLLQACLISGIAVPEQVAVVGIDNDPLARVLTRIPLSSVIQGTTEIGRSAAHMLLQMISGGQMKQTRILVPPVGINAQTSSRHEAFKHPHVMRARHFIRQYACLGIKSEQVADYVGVSRSSLEQYFRLEVGRSVHDEILRFKLDAATTILARDQTSIADVAVACGFTTVQYMHAVFKRELGCTPRTYQDRMRANGGLPPVADADAEPEHEHGDASLTDDHSTTASG